MLVVTALVLLAVTAVGVAMLSSSTSARFQRVNVGVAQRAHYLAESGIQFIRAQGGSIATNVTCTLANGDRFVVQCVVSNFIQDGHTNRGSFGRSIGIANPGQRIEGRRVITFSMSRRSDVRLLDAGFDNDGDLSIDDTWTFTREGDDTGKTQKPRIAAPPEGGLALEMRNWQGNFRMGWQSNPDLNLATAWTNQGRLLSYDVQAKVSAAKFAGSESKPVFNSALLVGVGFRLQNDNLSSYGASFYRRHPDSFSHNAPWIKDLDDTFLTTLSDTNLYITLWSREPHGKRRVIAYRRIRWSEGLLYRSPLDAGEYDIKPFSTILVRVREEFVGATTNRINRISVYTRSVDHYPRWPEVPQNYTHAKWPEDTTTFPTPVAWDNLGGATVVSDSTFTSAGFGAQKPPEINLHVYDWAVKYFDDFAIRVEGHTSPAIPGDLVQY